MANIQRVFLAAEWRNLLMLNYAVHPALLSPFLPAGTELDDFDGTSFVSLVAFEFNKTRILGRAVPFHQSFEEVNLRFYVRREWKRGVVFIRELVSRIAVTAVARLAFGENYSCVPMSHAIHQDGDATEAEYSWGAVPARCSMQAECAAAAYLPADGSLSQFITEHYWGYAAQRNGGCLEYEVRHPRWRIRDARSAVFSGDAENYYGPELARALTRVPDSAFFAEGSAVTVFAGARLDLAATVQLPAFEPAKSGGDHE